LARRTAQRSCRLKVEELEPRTLPATVLTAPLHFDFGTSTSPVATGYTGVSLTAYTASLGYGWQSLSGLNAVDRGTSDPLTTDFIKGHTATFLVNLPNGTYDITPTLGDALATRDVVLQAEGQPLVTGLATAAGQFLHPTFRVQVKGGQLSVQLTCPGLSGSSFAWDALDITAAGKVSSTQAVLSTHGLYVVGIPDQAVPSQALTDPRVDGVLIRASWNQVETGDGVYSWNYLDTQINNVAAAGKKVAVEVVPGVTTPGWVYIDGAQSFTFIDPTTGQVDKIPIPWDSVYLTKWEAFVQALGQRYAGQAALSHVKITGVNTTTGETFLPSTSLDVKNWQAVGYTPAKVQAAWQSIADTWSQAFPTQQLALVMVPGGFPPIDNNGNYYNPGPSGQDQTLTPALMNYGIATYSARFIIQNDGVSDNWISSQVGAVASQVTTGYQTLWSVTGDPTYQMNSGVAIALTTELQRAVDKAAKADAQFLEIYLVDVQNSNLQGVLANAHAEIGQNAAPTAVITGLPASGHSPVGTALALGSSIADPWSVDLTGLVYSWTVTDNGQTVATGSGASLSFTPHAAGSYVVSLKVTDTAGRTSLADVQTITTP
jgi:hypothetical protein